MSAIFYQIFICHQMIALQKLWKCFLFHLKSSFCSRDIQIFVFPSSPLFLPVSHCFRGWWKINLKVCDVISCLIKNLISHFVSFLKEEKRYEIETLSNDRVLNKEHFHWKIMQKMGTISDPFLTLVNNPKKPLYARNSFKNIFWKRIIKSP